MGWGFPNCWQGWLVFAVYLVLFTLGMLLLRGDPHPAKYIAFVSAITLALLMVCWKKGEPLRWRWGRD